jgi:hypothetical protein
VASAVATGGVVGIVAGSLLFLLLVGVLIWLLVRPRGHTTDYTPSGPPEVGTGIKLGYDEFENVDSYLSFQNADSGDFVAPVLWVHE